MVQGNGQHGGYRAPKDPAPVSGPGKYSRRTDGGPSTDATQAARYISGQDYGEGKVANEVANAAPLAAAPALTALPEGFFGFDAESQDIDEGEDEGSDYGEGDPYTPLDLAPDDEAVVETGQDPVTAIISAAYEANPTPELRTMLTRLRDEGR